MTHVCPHLVVLSNGNLLISSLNIHRASNFYLSIAWEKEIIVYIMGFNWTCIYCRVLKRDVQTSITNLNFFFRSYSFPFSHFLFATCLSLRIVSYLSADHLLKRTFLCVGCFLERFCWNVRCRVPMSQQVTKSVYQQTFPFLSRPCNHRCYRMWQHCITFGWEGKLALLSTKTDHINR